MTRGVAVVALFTVVAFGVVGYVGAQDGPAGTPGASLCATPDASPEASPQASPEIVTDASPAAVGRAAAAGGQVLTELRAVDGGGLEEWFLTRTADGQPVAA